MIPKKKGNVSNPTGRGGFGQRPQDIWKGGRGPAKSNYSDCLKKWYSLTPKELYAEANKPLRDRDDITVVEACAMLDAARAMVTKNTKQRQWNADRTEGKPKQVIEATVNPGDEPEEVPLEDVIQEYARSIQDATQRSKKARAVKINGS